MDYDIELFENVTLDLEASLMMSLITLITISLRSLNMDHHNSERIYNEFEKNGI